MLCRLRGIADNDVHLGKITGRIDLVAHLSRRGPDKEICRDAFAQRHEKYLVVVTLYLKCVAISDCQGENRLAQINDSEVIERRLNMLNLAEIRGLRSGADGGKSERYSQKWLHAVLPLASTGRWKQLREEAGQELDLIPTG
jgi:hypothetical protein